jgi:putative ABC transport system ATP-binding protein
MDQETPLLRTEKVSKLYADGNVQALAEVSLSIPRGQYVAIMGQSGSGKSTLLSLLGGLDMPTSGHVFYDGRPLEGNTMLDDFRCNQVGFVFQSFFLLPTLTALENVQIPMFEKQLSPTVRKQRAAELLETVGMSHRSNHLPSRLSVGERQRVAIARSLANDPQLLLADEPTGNLDSKTAEEVLKLFDHLQRNRGMTLIMVTHSEEVARYAQRILRIFDGHLVEDSMTSGVR